MVKALAAWSVLSLVALAAPVAAQDAASPPPGAVYVLHEPVEIGATVPCDSARYTMAEAAPAEGKAYTARSFGGAACTTSLDFVAPRAFAAAAPITIRAVMACDAPAASAGVEGATTTIRFIVLHDGKDLSGNINLVGSNSCTDTPLVFQATADLGGEEFAAGDTLTVDIIAFYTTGGAGDPNKNLHLKTGGADPSIVVVPDLAPATGGGSGNPPLFQDVTTPSLRVGRNATANLTQSETYNWTAAAPPVFSYQADVAAGEVRLLLTDGANATLLDETVDATGQANRTLEGSGNLTLRIDYVNFTGSLVVELAPQPAASTSGQPPAATPNDDDRTGTFPLSEDKGTPLPAAVPAAAVLLALAFAAVRRRLR